MVEQELAELYNLILNPNTREWERTLLIQAKNQVGERKQRKEILEMIEVSLRPLALRGNLTPDVMDFYLKITHDPMGQVSYDFAKHQIIDESYQEKAVFAGGCFWCLVEPFETRQGIISVLSGYTGGEVEHPNYDQVSSGTTGHVEAVEIIFDRRMINYEELLAIFWQVTDPTDAFGQFQDRGNQYRSIIFVENEEQKILAEKSKQQVIARISLRNQSSHRSSQQQLFGLLKIIINNFTKNNKNVIRRSRSLINNFYFLSGQRKNGLEETNKYTYSLAVT